MAVTISGTTGVVTPAVGIGTTPLYPSDIAVGTIGTTAGSQSVGTRLTGYSNNADILDISNVRGTAGAGWETAGWRIQQKVDSTWMGYIQFNGTANGTNNFGISFGTGSSTVSANSVTEKMRINETGDLLFNSGYGSAAVAYGCRAWVNFNGAAAGTFAGGTSTVSRTAGSTTATVTTTDAHGLITGNVVQALTGVVAGVYPVTVLTSTTFTITTAATTVLTAASITFAVNSIRASGNVTSIADHAVGDYTVNFATAMVDANYAVSGTAKRITADNLASTIIAISGITAPTTTAVRVFVSTINSGGWTALDSTHVNLAIHR